MTARFSRTAGAVVAAALLGLAAACGGSGSGVTVKSTPPADRVLRLSFLQDPGQPPDPDIYYSGQGLLLTTNLYEGLLKYQSGTAQPKIVPSLAESWTASKDNTTFTLKLRKGVVFHDGTPFTAAAVKPSFDRRAAVNQGPAYMVADVASVTTAGDYDVTIKLKTPDASFLDYLASAYGPKMMSPKAIAANSGKDHLQTYLQTHDVGTGAYTLTDAKVGSHYAM
ncbi:MAG: extracellular solute-binding protein family 5, partial [Actinomycetia bacterium]|nr:extracellular solute-binding protein family 5 [Actinomycetes bacterium]